MVGISAIFVSCLRCHYPSFPSGKHRATSAGSIVTLACDVDGNLTTRIVMGYPPHIKN